MKTRTNIILLILMTMGIIPFGACRKDFLEAKPSTAILQPTTLEEFQSLLDNYNNNISVGLGILSDDNQEYISDAIFLSARTPTERNAYTWSKDLYDGEPLEDWNRPYSTIFYANNVLAGLENVTITATNRSQWNNIKGWALFIRAFAFYDLTNSFAPIYDPLTSERDLGVPIKLDPSIDDIQPRATVKENYDRIISDLGTASALLPAPLPIANRNRPSKVAAYALFARIYLNRREYKKAGLYADSCLTIYSKLVDYNALSKTSTSPFTVTQDELIYSQVAAPKAAYGAGSPFLKISKELIDQYAPNDLRPVIFFSKQADGSYVVGKRGYHGTGLYPFTGLATDEIYLIKAECLARDGQPGLAMTILNQLLEKRWNPNASSPAIPYKPFSSSDPAQALSIILSERRKELVWRGLRWDDLKRLNKEGANISLTRSINNMTYTLEPNSKRYVFPIPDDEIALSSIPQNQR